MVYCGEYDEKTKEVSICHEWDLSEEERKGELSVVSLYIYSIIIVIGIIFSIIFKYCIKKSKYLYLYINNMKKKKKKKKKNPFYI